MNWNQNELEELAKVITKYGLTEVEITDGDKRISVKKKSVTDQAIQPYSAYQMQNQQMSSLVDSRYKSPVDDFRHITEMKVLQDELEHTKEDPIRREKDRPSIELYSESEAGSNYVTSPVAGIFYRQSQPGKSPYAKIGQRVKKGDVVCLVEAMKMINEISVVCDGIIKEFLVENEQFVEYGTPLILIEKE